MSGDAPDEAQRQTLAQLIERRSQVEAQFESCVLAVQNVRFDLLRLRSAGVAAVLDDLTSATQQARALSVDVEAAISAARQGRSALAQACAMSASSVMKSCPDGA